MKRLSEATHVQGPPFRIMFTDCQRGAHNCISSVALTLHADFFLSLNKLFSLEYFRLTEKLQR